MKAYALGRRSKWKDYVDIYFLLTQHFTLDEVVGEANRLFENLFSEKLFRAQLSYFEDIDYTEPVDYIIQNPPTEQLIKDAYRNLNNWYCLRGFKLDSTSTFPELASDLDTWNE